MCLCIHDNLICRVLDALQQGEKTVTLQNEHITKQRDRIADITSVNACLTKQIRQAKQWGPEQRQFTPLAMGSTTATNKRLKRKGVVGLTGVEHIRGRDSVNSVLSQVTCCMHVCDVTRDVFVL